MHAGIIKSTAEQAQGAVSEVIQRGSVFFAIGLVGGVNLLAIQGGTLLQGMVERIVPQTGHKVG